MAKIKEYWKDMVSYLHSEELKELNNKIVNKVYDSWHFTEENFIYKVFMFIGFVFLFTIGGTAFLLTFDWGYNLMLALMFYCIVYTIVFLYHYIKFCIESGIDEDDKISKR